jgi:hypothetical protein
MQDTTRTRLTCTRLRRCIALHPVAACQRCPLLPLRPYFDVTGSHIYCSVGVSPSRSGRSSGRAGQVWRDGARVGGEVRPRAPVVGAACRRCAITGCICFAVFRRFEPGVLFSIHLCILDAPGRLRRNPARECGHHLGGSARVADADNIRLRIPGAI